VPGAAPGRLADGGAVGVLVLAGLPPFLPATSGAVMAARAAWINGHEFALSTWLKGPEKLNGRVVPRGLVQDQQRPVVNAVPTLASCLPEELYLISGHLHLDRQFR
jgi:hypothetical protein